MSGIHESASGSRPPSRVAGAEHGAARTPGSSERGFRAPANLRELVDALRRARAIVDIECEVDARLEIAEVHRRVIAAGGPALLFRNVKGSTFPVVTNLFGSSQRIELAFGSRPREIVAEIARLPIELMPPSLGKLWQKRGLFKSLSGVGLSRRSGAPVAQVVQSPPRLSSLPALQTWPRDGGAFITLPLVYTEHPDTRGSNLGMYRIQLFDDARCGVHMQIGKGGGFHLAAAEAANRALPVNVFVGGPPALMLGAIAPLPENVPELLLASLVLGKKLALAHNPAGPLPLVAEADFAIVGEITPLARHPEGPFGDHYGYYSEVHDYPLMRVDALMHRRDAIFPATVVGKPRQEDFFLGDHLQELLSPLFPVVMPSVRALWSYGETGYHALSAAIVHERYKREALVSAFRILGEGQLSLTKFLLLTNRTVDLHDFKATLTHVLERADFRTDLFLFGNLSMDSLDYCGPRINEGSKGVLLGIGDPIRKLPREFAERSNGRTLPAAISKARVFSPGCLVIQLEKHSASPEDAARLARDPALQDWPLIVLSDDADRHVKSALNFLWCTFTRFNPAVDIHAAKIELVGTQPSFTPPIVIDARMKPGYPEELFCDPKTAQLVDRRWKDYFPAGQVEMGDSDRAHLD
jgi:UbiD family decarboxylase